MGQVQALHAPSHRGIRRLFSGCAVLSLAVALAASAQAPATTVPAPPRPHVAHVARPTIQAYIDQSWTGLERSMTDCQSLVDPKTKTVPVLYLPQELPEPAAVRALEAGCGVHAEHLPRRIDHPGALMPSEVAKPGLLYLPNPYIVPGGRFNEMYGWDSYFILQGLVTDKHLPEGLSLAQGMVENFFFEIEHYGNLLNANRTYFLTRSQPPLLSSMIRMVYDASAAAPQGSGMADPWLAKAYGYAVRDHALWLTPEHAAGDTGLARFHDLGEGPVPEMADASTYYPDIVRWLLRHPEVKTDYLVDGPATLPTVADTANDPELAELAAASCDVAKSEVCEHAHVGLHWLSRSFYEGDRAMRESGFDTTFRFGPFSGSTQQFAPVCLNALLYKYELDLAWMADHLGKPAESAEWTRQAAARKAAMDKYLWNAERGLYFDYNFTTHTQSTYTFIATFYPLWAGAASPEQASAVAANLPLFLEPGGVATSIEQSGVQWDLPYGWAPTTFFTVAGLERAGAHSAARMVAKRFLKTVANGYAQDGTLREKYNVVSSNADVIVSAGYKQNVIGFGWTNGVFLKLQQFLAAPAAKATGALIGTP
ncbi:trehalase family glycosidase [Acidipila sp. EB88]|uniref:trehalase family glycosidase n=1 Tax=Acidipila sp. EB88 TaxID=2305226 RepID=UPI000F5F14AB|nr:trehalase family glycosidase [Acidipila sp. EB88]RRA48061.1 trehalase [Acidipila sp. EB88]